MAYLLLFFFKQKTAYEMRISDWSSDVCSSDLLQHLLRLAPQTREQELRNYLGGFGFSGDTVNSPIAPMSGCEKARLALSLIVWQKPNLLLLDEPSNHLDVDTREALATDRKSTRLNSSH